MRIEDRIKEERGSDTIAVIEPIVFSTVSEAAVKHGLCETEDCYEQVEREEAQPVIANALHQDMAYKVELVSLELARSLAAEFVAQFEESGTRFYTNGGWGRPRVDPGVGPSWCPATSATFDTGVIVLSPTKTGCVWFQDED